MKERRLNMYFSLYMAGWWLNPLQEEKKEKEKER